VRGRHRWCLDALGRPPRTGTGWNDELAWRHASSEDAKQSPRPRGIGSFFQWAPPRPPAAPPTRAVRTGAVGNLPRDQQGVSSVERWPQAGEATAGLGGNPASGALTNATTTIWPGRRGTAPGAAERVLMWAERGGRDAHLAPAVSGAESWGLGRPPRPGSGYRAGVWVWTGRSTSSAGAETSSTRRPRCRSSGSSCTTHDPHSAESTGRSPRRPHIRCSSRNTRRSWSVCPRID
jgi:hypothetical protein